jgi:signal transduction histidine kinase
MSDAAAAPTADVLDPTGFSSLLLNLSVSGVLLMRPCYEMSGEIVDFDGVRLNPAAQQMLRLPECPAESFLTLYSTAKQAGIFDFYREAFRSDTVARRQNLYQLDGLDGYYLLVAQRYQDLLVVSFTDTNDQPRSAVEDALRASQAREQAALAEAERQRALLYRVFEEAPAMICILQGPAHVFEFANASYRGLVGERPLLGRPFAEAFAELVGQGIMEPLQEVYRTGKPFYANEQLARIDHTNSNPADLEYRYYNLVWQARRDLAGAVDGVLVFAYDVTPQVRARQQVEQLNAELEARVQARTQEALALQADLLEAVQRQVQVRESFYQIFEQTPAAVSLLRGPTYRFEYVNPVYQQVFAGRQLVGRDFADALPDAAAQGYVVWLEGVYRTGETFFGTEVPFVSEQPDSSPHTVYFNFTYQAYRENGQIVGISTFALEVTEQVLARQEREAQRQQLEQLFRQAPLPIVILDGPDLVFQLVNPAYQRIFPGRALADKPLLEALPELVGTPIPDLFQRVYQTGEPVTVQELPLWMARHEGHAPEEIYWTFTYQARRTAHGLIDGVRVFAQDVTEQVRTRQRVQKLNEELDEANQALAAINEELTTSNEELGESNTQLTRTNIDLDNFIYTASHDLKAPITNIEGLLLALEHELPETARTGDVPLMLTMMQDAVDRFRRTITHLTDLSRLQKEHNPDADTVALAPVVEAVRLDLMPLLTHTQGQLTVTIPDGLTVTFAEKNLRSVVYNLLSNAFKYHYPNRVPEVQLRSWLADDYAVLEVQDNGLGMDLARSQAGLFAMFQRLHTHVEGTGVGLYMVKRIVENAGGRIDVTSQLGQGSTFRIYFPR